MTDSINGGSTTGDKVRLASVGLGRWARVLARGIQRGDQVEIYSCFSRDEAKRTAFQEEYGVPNTASTYEELLADPAVEGVIVTTPNQLSALSLLTLIAKGSFSAFQDGDYPAHRTALLEVDLRRIAAESGLDRVAVEYTRWGRLPLSGMHYPEAIAALAPRRFSDNVAMIGRRCA